MSTATTTGHTVETIQGRTGTYRLTRLDGLAIRCTCPGYTYRRTCRHLVEANTSTPETPETPAAVEVAPAARLPRSLQHRHQRHTVWATRPAGGPLAMIDA